MIEGDELTVDLSGCSPQVMGPSNATLSSRRSTVFYALIASADVPIAANAGYYRPVRIIAPPGSVPSTPTKAKTKSPSAISMSVLRLRRKAHGASSIFRTST
jgi:N-methylhydantoinase B